MSIQFLSACSLVGSLQRGHELLFLLLAIVFIHETNGFDVVTIGDVMEAHDVSGQDQAALVAVVQDGVVREEVLDDVVSSLEFDTASDLASLSSIGILLSVEEREEVQLPGHNTALLHNIFHVLKLNTIVLFRPVHLKLFFRFEGFATLGTRHLESCLKLYIFVLVYLLLALVVLTVPFLPDLMLNRLTMSLKQFLAHETLRTRFALVATLALNLVVRAQT